MKRLLFIALTIAATVTANAQILAVKTNALMDVAMVPNVGFELVTGNRTSINANTFIGYRIYGKNWNVQAVNPEFRYYPMSKVMNKLFIGVSTLFTHYDMDFTEENFMGDALGGGLTFGWVMPLTQYHWNIEFECAVGAIYYTHRRSWLNDYHPRTELNREYNEHGMMFMPFKLGVNFSYIFKYKNEVDSKMTRKKRKAIEAVQKQQRDSIRLELEAARMRDSIKIANSLRINGLLNTDTLNVMQLEAPAQN